jgi:hypothetical protein
MWFAGERNMPSRSIARLLQSTGVEVGFSIPLVNKRSGVNPPICKAKACFAIPASRGVTDAQDAGNEIWATFRKTRGHGARKRDRQTTKPKELKENLSLD